MTELVYKSSWCQAIPLTHMSNIDEAVDALIGKVFAKKVDRLFLKNGKYYYSPSKEYFEHVASMRKIK